MRYHFYLLTFSLIVSSWVNSQNFSYKVSMPEPHTHYFEVEWTVTEWKANTLEAKIPVWAPGSYLIREFAKSVENFSAQNDKGEILSTNKTSKNTWQIQTENESTILIKYKVYAFELSVRTSFLDADHGYINGTSVFFYADGYQNKGGILEIIPYKEWTKVSTSLPQTGKFTYSYSDYDQLADCPIEIGNQVEFEFEASGIKHRVAMYGEGNYEISTLQKDMAKIVESCTKIFGENPNDDYLFIIHNLTVGSGGLEHMNSTTLQVNRMTYKGDNYLGFLSLVAHEYFHLWNVKRLRPEALGPFNYDEENYTTMLWVMEGFTSYYDELLLLRTGFYDNETYLNKIMGTMNYVESLPGNKVQSLSESSFDAWIKAYRPNENSRNTTVSYYSKGSLVALLLDIKIIQESKGKKCLDDFMKELYEEFHKNKNRGFTDDEFMTYLKKYLSDAEDFINRYVNDVQPLPYEEVFKVVGVNINLTEQESEELGVTLNDREVRSVTRGTPAYLGGINVGDELISINDLDLSSTDIATVIKQCQGEEITVMVNRDSQIKVLKFKLFPVKKNTYSYSLDKKNKLFNCWLSE